MKPSAHGELNKQDWAKVKADALYFLAVPATIYLTAVLGAIQQDGFALSDFIPTTITIGAIVGYVLNTLLNLFRKYTNGK